MTDEGPWTLFWDMHSGGHLKEKWHYIYIQASESEAKVIFYNRFGHNPERVTCTCCGEDYSIYESQSFAQASGFHRNCICLETPLGASGRYEEPADPWWKAHYYLEPEDEAVAIRRGYSISRPSYFRLSDYQTVEQYRHNEDVLIIETDDIKPEERLGDIPVQGYVWQD